MSVVRVIRIVQMLVVLWVAYSVWIVIDAGGITTWPLLRPALIGGAVNLVLALVSSRVARREL